MAKTGSATLTIFGVYSDNSVNGTGGQSGMPLYNRNNEIVFAVETACHWIYGKQHRATIWRGLFFEKSWPVGEFSKRASGKEFAYCTVTANKEEYKLSLGSVVLILVSVVSYGNGNISRAFCEPWGWKKESRPRYAYRNSGNHGRLPSYGPRSGVGRRTACGRPSDAVGHAGSKNWRGQDNRKNSSKNNSQRIGKASHADKTSK